MWSWDTWRKLSPDNKTSVSGATMALPEGDNIFLPTVAAQQGDLQGTEREALLSRMLRPALRVTQHSVCRCHDTKSNFIQCVHGSTDIVRHTVTPLYDDISKIWMVLWNQHVCGFILVYDMPGYSHSWCAESWAKVGPSKITVNFLGFNPIP